MSKTLQGQNWLLTPAADGRRYSKYPDGTGVAFNVWVQSLGNPSPGYRIYDPGTATWGAWQTGGLEAESTQGTVTAVVGTLLAGPFVFPDGETITVDTMVESAAVTVSAEGHQVQVRRKSGLEVGVTRYLDVYIGAQVSQFYVTVTQDTVDPEPPVTTDDPRQPYWPTPTASTATGTAYFIPTSTSDYNASGFAAGSVININGGTRGRLIIRNVQGTAANPILIRNNPASTERVRFLDGGNTGFTLRITGSKHFIVDGLFKWVGASADPITHGIHFEANPNQETNATNCPTSYIFCGDTTTDYTVRGVSIDSKRSNYPPYLGNSETNSSYVNIGPGIGIQLVDNGTGPGTLLWRENITVEYCDIRETRSEAMYVGPNWNGARTALRNIRLRYNWCENTGWDAINLKSVIAGINEIHSNVIVYTGLAGRIGQQGEGIGTDPMVRVHSNFIYRPAMQGIIAYSVIASGSTYAGQPIAEPDTYVYNNVIIDAGYNQAASQTGQGHGVVVDMQSNTLRPRPIVYNNTIIKSYHRNITGFGSLRAGEIRNNISCEPISGADIGVGAQHTVSNNITGTIAAQSFVNTGAQNYRLQSGSPAKDAGTAALAPPVDFDNVTRPQGAAIDCGAFELEVV